MKTTDIELPGVCSSQSDFVRVNESVLIETGTFKVPSRSGDGLPQLPCARGNAGIFCDSPGGGNFFQIGFAKEEFISQIDRKRANFGTLCQDDLTRIKSKYRALETSDTEGKKAKKDETEKIALIVCD